MRGNEYPVYPVLRGCLYGFVSHSSALHNGATFNFEDNPKSKRNLACPDNGYVVFKVTLIEN